MISSRQPITSRKVKPFLMSSSALLRQTSVPWDNPDIWTKSLKLVGLVASSIFRTKGVPNSGKPNAPVFSGYVRGSTFKAFGEENKDKVSGSLKGTVLISTPLTRSNIFIAVGSTWPKISNFKTLLSISWNSKWVVSHLEFGLFAGNCTGVKSCTSI